MSRDVNASKILIIKLDSITGDIHRLWKTVDSPYILQKRMLSEARSKLYSETKAAYKIMKKAHAEMIEESIAAQEYNRFKNLISQLDDPRVQDLDSKYHDALAKGHYKQAREIAQKMSSLDAIKDVKHSVSVKLEDSNDDILTYVLTNSSNSDVTIKRFTVTMDQKTLHSDSVYPFVIGRNTSRRLVYTRIKSESDSAQFFLEYEEGGIVKTASSQSHLVSAG